MQNEIFSCTSGTHGQVAVWVLILLVFDFQRPVGALIDASETEAEPPTLYNKVPAALTLFMSMKTLRVNNLCVYHMYI